MEPLHCDPQGPRTVKELMGAPVWVAVNGKRPVGFQHGRQWWQWQATIAEDEGGLAVARYGGEQRRRDGEVWRVPAWSDGLTVLERLRQVDVEGMPGLAQSGSSEHPCPHSVGVIDVDYKPSEDEDGRGLGLRDEYRKRFFVLGLPTMESGGGNGLHALFRSPVSGEWFKPYAYPQDGAWNGLRVEVFPAGRRGSITLHPRNRLNGADHIPVVSADGVERLIETRPYGAHDYFKPEACPCLPIQCVVCGSPKEVAIHGWRCFRCAEDFLEERFPDRFHGIGFAKGEVSN